MAEQFTKEEIRQAFYDLAEAMEKECVDWQSWSETDADRDLKDKILKIAKERLDDKRSSKT